MMYGEVIYIGFFTIYRLCNIDKELFATSAMLWVGCQKIN